MAVQPKLNPIQNLRDLLGVVAAYCRLEAAIVDELDAQHSDIYALKENEKRNLATIRAQGERIDALERIVRSKVTV